MLAEGASLAAGAEVVAERILDVLATPFEIADIEAPLSVTASIGIAEGRRATPDELLRDADIALYQAKAAGKKCAVVFAPAMQDAVHDHLTLEKDLHDALDAEPVLSALPADLRSVLGGLYQRRGLVALASPQPGGNFAR